MEPVLDNQVETVSGNQTEGLVDSLDQCELEEGWSTVPKRGKSRVDSVGDDMVPHEMLLRAVQDDGRSCSYFFVRSCYLLSHH